MDAVPALMKALEDQDANVRWGAAYALGEIGAGSVDAIPALVKLLQDNNEVVRLSATGALGEVGKDAVPILIQALQSEKLGVQAYVAWALGKIGVPDAIAAIIGILPELIQALQNPVTRGAATGALGEMGRDAVPALILSLIHI